MTRILDRIDGPSDLHALSDDELQQVAQEVRELLIDTVGEIGGHFGANLGACEIAVALHSLLDSPTRQDPLGRRPPGLPAQDPHRPPRPDRDDPQVRRARPVLLDLRVRARHHGRRPRLDLDRLRASGSRRRCATASATPGRVAAVIGDGAMTGGVAFEAIHQAGGLGTPLVVVLNDNGMSISPNVGALSRYFNRVRLEPKMWRAREGVEEKLTKLPAGIGARFERLGPQLKESIKAFTSPGLLWEELDWAYMGVIDGHDVARAAQRAAAAPSRPSAPSSSTSPPSRARASRPPRRAASRAWRSGTPPSRSRSPSACRRPPRPSQGRQARAAAVHAGVRRGARARVPPRRARGRHHRRDELRHRPLDPPEGAARALLRRRHRRAAGGAVRLRPRDPGRAPRRARSTRPSCSAPTTRSSTTSASRACRSCSAWTAPASSATTARPTTARSTSPTCAACPNITLMAPRDEAMLVHMLHTALRHDAGPVAIRYPRGEGVGVALPGPAAAARDRHRRDPPRGRARGDPRLRHRRRQGARRRRHPRRGRPRRHRRRRPLRQAARHRPAGPARGRARPARDRRGGRAERRLRLRRVGVALRARARRRASCASACPTAT